MAATRKRKSTRSPAKSKKAKAEEDPVQETPEVKEEAAADGEDEAKAALVRADSKDTQEAAAALLAVSGGEPKSVVDSGDGEFLFM